jgi:hypothetical protein
MLVESHTVNSFLFVGSLNYNELCLMEAQLIAIYHIRSLLGPFLFIMFITLHLQ